MSTMNEWKELLNTTGVFQILQPGENIITWTGNLIKIEVQPKSRWL